MREREEGREGGGGGGERERDIWFLDFFIERMTVLGRGLVFQPERERERDRDREHALTSVNLRESKNKKQKKYLDEL